MEAHHRLRKNLELTIIALRVAGVVGEPLGARLPAGGA
jgi:hypothetical protein